MYTTQQYVRKLYKFLNEQAEVSFRYLKKNRGYIQDWDTPKPLVVLDPRDNVLSTLIHEFLHYVHPDWGEKRVLKWESKVARSLSERQVKNLLKLLGSL